MSGGVAEASRSAARAVGVAAGTFSVAGAAAFVEAGERHELGAADNLLPSLARAVYARCHLGLPGYRDPEGIPLAAREDADLVRRLRAARPGRRYADAGWTVVAREGDRVTVTKDRLRLRVEGDGLSESGGDARVWFPAERRLALAGYFVAIGSAGPPTHADGLTRVYLHATPQCAPRLLGALVDALDARPVQFQLKLANHAAAYRRPDACVLYLAPEHRGIGCAAALGLPAPWFAVTTPGFARRLGRGIAVAHGPADLSWGRHCSEVVAAGLRTAWESRVEPLVAVCAALAAAGIDPEVPDGLPR